MLQIMLDVIVNSCQTWEPQVISGVFLTSACLALRPRLCVLSTLRFLWPHGITPLHTNHQQNSLLSRCHIIKKYNYVQIQSLQNLEHFKKFKQIFSRFRFSCLNIKQPETASDWTGRLLNTAFLDLSTSIFSWTVLSLNANIQMRASGTHHQ